MASKVRLAGCAAGLVLLAGCSFAPKYRVPDVPIPATFKEEGIWTRATPEDTLPKTAWWTLYDDATLDTLEAQIAGANPTLAEALARYDRARAQLSILRAGLYPEVDTGAHALTNRQSDFRPLRSASQPDYYGDDLFGFSLDYEIDLWGRVRNTVASGKAEMESSADDLVAVRLSLEGQLADTYIQLRGLDGQIKLLNDTIGVYDKALALTNDRHAKGIASGLDVARAETQLEDAKSDLTDTAARRALLEHAIASLIGKAASDFSLPASTQDIAIPNVPVAIPSVVLQQRPDVAAAERRVAAANAEIGVARAAFFPTLSLNALAGFQNTGGAGLLTMPDSYWTLGPSAAMALFDAGKRQSLVRAAKADYRETAAAYRADVLQAFQDVENSLALLNYLADEAASKTKSVQSATRTASMAIALYRLGATSYLDVVTAQTEALKDQLAALSLQTRRLQASVKLIQAVGGGWSAESARASATGPSPLKSTASESILPKNASVP